ncbi:GcrA cell cycle regulator, partial [Sphingomonas koreensis]|uniref:GcrA family cell cycle regulator n=1 Tax=Sphingomonas koreensis TaxID=93064 RepID=UPI0010016AA8
MSWTDERIETLRKMWDSGLTATQIAEELGGVSRNAVIGKAHRLGLASRPSPVKPNATEAKAAAAPAPEAAPAPRPTPAPQPTPRPPPAPPAAERATTTRHPAPPTIHLPAPQ